jgi:hypothetical protein
MPMIFRVMMFWLALIGTALAQQNPISPVEQRLVNTISALIFENARFSAELYTARQTIAKLQAEKEEITPWIWSRLHYRFLGDNQLH